MTLFFFYSRVKFKCAWWKKFNYSWLVIASWYFWAGVGNHIYKHLESNTNLSLKSEVYLIQHQSSLHQNQMQNSTCFASFFLLPRVLSTSILLSSCKYLEVNGALVCARVLPIPFCSSFRQTSRVVRAPVVTALFEARFAWNSDSQGKPLTYCALDNIFLAKCHFETLVPRAYSFRDSIWVSRLWFWDSMGFETLIPRLYGFRDSDSENVSKNCLHGPCSADSPTLLRMKIWHTWIVWVYIYIYIYVYYGLQIDSWYLRMIHMPGSELRLTLCTFWDSYPTPNHQIYLYCDVAVRP